MKKIKIEGTELEVRLETETDILASPTNDETNSFVFVDKAESTGKVQRKYKKGTVKVQGKYKESTNRKAKSTAKHPKRNSETAMKHARKHLPQKTNLLNELETKWYIIETLQNDVYHEGEINGFDELVTKLEVGAIRYCPRPQWHAVNKQLKEPISLTQVTRTLKLFIVYKNSFYPTGFWLWLDNSLNRIDSMLNWITRIAV